MKFDSTIAKWDIHNVAYDVENEQLKLGPTVKVLVKDEYHIAISLHKWIESEGKNKGSYICVLALGPDNSVDSDEAQNRLEAFKALFDENHNIFSDIQKGKVSEYVHVYKFSVNVWRSVIFKGTKWTYNDITKPCKDEPCIIQRLLV